ncbi:MAG: branched-chain amino acid transaminase [Polyangiaceae bacterium]
MTRLDIEWPNFAGVPEDDALTSFTRPESQELARWVWLDGEFREAEQTRVHYYANALHYGTAVFEGIRAYPTPRGTALFRVDDHVDRLLDSSKLYGMKLEHTAEAITRAIVELTSRNDIRNGYVRPLAFYGHGPIDLTPRRGCPVHLLVAVRGLGAFLGASALRNGIRLTISSWRKFHHSMFPTMAKASGHYANSVLAAHEAMSRGFDDAILLNQDGTIASATGMNLFFVRDGVLYTNDEQSSIVPGITRDSILTLAKDNNIKIEVRPFTREELQRADEIFLTGTAAEVTPVRELEDVPLRTGRQTMGAFLQRVYMRAVLGLDEHHEDWLTYV